MTRMVLWSLLPKSTAVGLPEVKIVFRFLYKTLQCIQTTTSEQLLCGRKRLVVERGQSRMGWFELTGN